MQVRHQTDRPLSDPRSARGTETALAIDAQGLGKRFGTLQALRDFSLVLRPGEALGLIGTNGAGKSTVLKLLQGLRSPDSGGGRIFGHPLGSHAAKQLVGITPQNADFPEQITPRELLGYAAGHFTRPKPMAELIAAFGLDRLIDRRMGGFSGGEKRRVALALAFVGNPSLVFLDEPTSGLDTVGQDLFRAYARAYADAGGSLLLTSHHWDEIEQVCDRIVMIDRGRQILEGTLRDIRRRAGRCRVSFALAEDAGRPAWLTRDFLLEAGRWQKVTADSDALVRFVLRELPDLRALQVTPLDLKDTIAELREEATA
ncbi:ABC transporter ATP-binding protein [Algihabitans albus]|uniref:ABC transporter ATP-binding protein n=1 Tax=Algihabitans albus TaxID=2164067 RepID=UPI000E5D35EA|nr:ABC transporter ATP-binding protein [Algihabitans albus]